MVVLACNRPPLRVFRDPSCVGRRELLSDSVSSISSQRATTPASDLRLASRSTEEQSLDLRDTMCSLFPFTTRRMLFSAATLSLFLHTSKHLSVALALGDSSVTTEDVAPRVFLSGPLFPSEERTVEIFEKNTYSVVNIFDVTLQPRLNATGSIEVPEGNGSGVVWNNNGHIVTNYHGASAGVGFAIPSSTVLRIVPQLIQFGKVVRAGLNAEIAPDPIANQLNVRNGALVLQIPSNSVAAQAGLIPTTRGLAGNIVLGDVIVAVNDKPVRSRADLLKAFEEYNVGDTVLLKIQRGNQSLELPLVLEETSI